MLNLVKKSGHPPARVCARIKPRPFIPRWMVYCWLCDYNREPEARQISQYIAENAAHMGVQQLAVAVHEVLAASVPDADGISTEVIAEHIGSHTLVPSVRVAGILRTLLDLNEKIASTLASVDEDGNTVIEKKNVDAYLKVTNEIMQMYRSEKVNRALFPSAQADAKEPAEPK